MDKVLFTGGSHAELPMIEAAKKLGYYVITTGNNTDGEGHKLADEYIPGDFSDKEFVLKLARDNNVVGMVSGCNDFAYISTAYACEKLGLPGHDTYEVAQRIHIKNKFRACVESAGVITPIVRKCSSTEDCENAIKDIGFPLLVKPVDLTGGKGVLRCDNADEVLTAFNDAMAVTRESYVILEEFVEGSPHGITTLIKDGKVVFYIVDNEQYGINKYLVLGACSPSDLSEWAIFSLINDIEKVVNEAGLVDGLFHTQFIVNKSGYPILIDPCRRAPGDLYVLLAKYVTGVDYPMEIVKAELGLGISDSYKMEKNFIARECIMTDHAGKIKGVKIDPELEKYIIHTHWLNVDAEFVDDPMKFKAGILIMKFDSYKQMYDILSRFSELAVIETE